MTRILRLAPLILVMLLVLLLFGVAQPPITTCEIQTQITVAAHPSTYYTLLGIWQAIFNSSPQSGRFFSLLCMILTLIVIYRLTLELYNQRYALWSLIIIAAVASSSRLFGVDTIATWLVLLTVLSTWLFWRLLNAQAKSRWVFAILYGFTLILMITSHWLMFTVIIFHLIYLIMSRRFSAPLRLVPLAVTLVLLIILRITLGASTEPSWSTFIQETPPLILGLLILSLGGALIWFLDRPQKPQLFVALWFVIPLLAMFLIGLPDSNMALILAIPGLLVLIYTLANTTLRVQVGIGLLVAVWLFPTPVSSSAILDTILNKTADSTAVVIDLPAVCFDQSDALTQLSRHPIGSPIYIHLDNATAWAVISPTGESRLLDAPPALSDMQDYWVLEANTPTAPGPTLVFQHDYGTLLLRHYVDQKTDPILATHDVVYQAGPLSLLKFTVPDTNLDPESGVVLTMWWAIPQAVDDNYLLKVELLDSKRVPIASDETLIAQSYTKNWEPGTVYRDRRIITIPKDTIPGRYDLVISAHGSTHIPLVAFTQNQNAIGNFGYLTTITVQK